jgi:hypothetical protein
MDGHNSVPVLTVSYEVSEDRKIAIILQGLRITTERILKTLLPRARNNSRISRPKNFVMLTVGT